MLDIVTEESFDLDKTYEYILSIQVSLNGFSFSVISPDYNKLLYFENKTIKISSSSLLNRHLRDWLQSGELFQKPFQKVRIIVLSELFSLVPEKFYGEPLKNMLPRILFDNKVDFEVAENVINKLNAKLIFTLPAGLNNTILNHWENYEIIHPVKLIINNLPETENENGLVLLFDAGNFYTVMYNQNTVLAVNNFKMGHLNDVVYFCLTMLNQSGISPDKTTLFITDIKNHSFNFEKELKPHFPDILQLDTMADVQESTQKIPFTHRCN